MSCCVYLAEALLHLLSSDAHCIKGAIDPVAHHNHNVGFHERTSSPPTLGRSLHFRLSSLPCFLISRFPGAHSDRSSLLLPSNGFPKDRFLIIVLTKITVARLGMCLTEFSTSSSVTSMSVQFSSSVGSGSAPFLVTHGCNFN